MKTNETRTTLDPPGGRNRRRDSTICPRCRCSKRAAAAAGGGKVYPASKGLSPVGLVVGGRGEEDREELAAAGRA